MIANRESGLTIELPSDREILLTRVFDAPRRLVFDAFTKPEHVIHWWGLKGSTLPVCEIDLRPGGAWRFVTCEADGNEYGFGGEIREVAPPASFVWTFEFDGMPGHVLVETMTFDEHDGKTTVRTRSLFASKEDRDGMLQSGMETGAAESWDRLASYLRTM